MGLRLAVAVAVVEQEPIKSDEQYMDMPVAVFRRTVETQVQKDVRALKELASRPTVQVLAQEEKAPAELPPSLAAILGACGPLSHAHAHAWQTQHTRMCTLTRVMMKWTMPLAARAEAMTPKRADGTSDLSMLRKKLGTCTSAWCILTRERAS
jgi:hypothetical protein